ncbi:cyanoexosortase B system-associated protein [Sphaerothrix gracilis]|uniref:cyanoexosortase B system-associated protein n=1 Tax=Sphaerothrix gracilis TaxID=3151835 RepID=UPI0031FD0009
MMALKLPPRLTKGLIVAVLAILAAIAALPNYFTGSWPWTRPPEVAQIDQLKALSAQTLAVPGWQVADSREIAISGHDWLVMELQPQAPSAPLTSATLLLRPQPWHDNQPEVEWLDLAGSQDWQMETPRQVRFASAATEGNPVKARFFRGRNERGTFAVMQWYAWSDGGHHSPSRWFIADQMTQWRDRQRLPWIAVCLLTSMEPLSSLAPYEAALSDLASQIQANLQTGPLTLIE